MSKLSFTIEHMDPLGQGVCKQGKNITFIAGTLPNESGTAQIYKRSKGVQFGHVDTLEKTASNRIPPECTHFENCPGCQYLHTDYASELVYKKQALLRQLKPLGVTDIEVMGAPQRLGYRNRIQLHYKKNTLGLIDSRTHQIVEIPHCQLIQEELRSALEQLYTDKEWEKQSSNEGHCELYYRDNKVQIEWNQPYAQGGFTQVNTAMNLSLQKYVQECAEKKPYDTVLDLFSGNGNLSQPLMKQASRRTLVDLISHDKNHDFIALDLHKKTALKQFSTQNPQGYDLMLIDPPRKGFAELPAWIKQCQPQQIIYVSCHAATLARDLKNIPQGYRIDRTLLLDMFPGTHHFETVVQLTRED